MVVLFGVAYQVRNRPLSSRSTFAVILPFLWLFVAFRFEVGCDWFGYEMHFRMQDPEAIGEFIPKIDTFYWILIDLINYVGLSHEFLNIVTATLFFGGLSIFVRQFPNPMGILAFSFPILIFAIPMSATRQALAMGVLFFAFTALIRAGYLRGALMIVLAAQFHVSAIIFLALVPLIYFCGKLKGWLVAMPFFAIGAVPLLQSQAFEIASARYIEGENDALGAVFRTFLTSIIGFYYRAALSRRWSVTMPASYPLVNTASLFLIGIFPAAFLVPTIADRYGYYLFIFAAVIAACIPFAEGRSRNVKYLAVMCGMFVFFIGWALLSWQVQTCYAPYQSWILGFPDPSGEL